MTAVAALEQLTPEQLVERCRSCRTFMTASDSMTRRMLTDAPRADTPPAVRAPAERIPARRLPALAAAAAVVALLLAAGLARWRMAPAPRVGSADVQGAALALVSPLTGGYPLADLAHAVTPDTHLERELQALSGDALLAARHLLACLDR